MREDLSPAMKKHLQALHKAASKGDPESFGAALKEIRADTMLKEVERGALIKTVAQEQAASYTFIITGKAPRAASNKEGAQKA